MTANDTEFKTVRHFFKEKDEKDYSYHKEPTLKEKTKFTEDYRENPRSSFDYDLIEIGDVQGIHMKCINHYGGKGADDAVEKILKEAKMKDWPLKMIFCVGCCGCSSDEIWRGYVLISNTLVDISGGKLEKDKFIANEVAREMSSDWMEWVLKCEEKDNSPVIKVKRADCILSGTLVIKNEKVAKDLRGDRELVGIEMEGWGIAHNLHQKDKLDLPGRFAKKDFLIVKGVSDHADSDKNTPQSTLFLGEQTGPVDDEKRQEIATLQSTALVCRAIAIYM